MIRVLKYQVPLKESFSVNLPEGAEVLTVQAQHEVPQMWARVDDTKPSRERRFMLTGTGHDIKGPGRYVETVQLAGGSLVLHLFEVEG